MPETIQIILTIVGMGITMLLALSGFAWRLGGRLESIDRRMGEFGAGIRSLNRQMTLIVGFLGNASRFLHRSGAMTDEEYHDSVARRISCATEGTEPYVDHLTESTNPLTRDEVRRLRELVNKAHLGEVFSYEETEEYNKLIRKVQAEHPDDSGVWPLVALGAFLSGLYPGRRGENSG
jgi:hypothetical protein